MSVTKIPVDGLSGGEGILSAAYTGVLETNATFVDQAIFGPSVDGKSWNGKWSVASLYSSLMLVTIEDAGADTQVNIWDLTEVSSSAPSTTPLGTVTLSGDATPTSVAACMGYIIVGSEDGISIIDPHSGSWAERTVGWPRSLTSSTTPALTNNDVQAVAATLSDSAAYDPRTGGSMPTFGLAYGTGADCVSILKDDGNVYDVAGTIGDALVVGFIDQKIFHGIDNSGDDQIRLATVPISLIQADDWSTNNYLRKDRGSDNFLGGDNGAVALGPLAVFADSDGLSLSRDPVNTASAQEGLTVMVNRTYTTGYFTYDTRGTWLANSKTADRSGNSNTLTENGTVTEAAVESGAELLGYSGFSDSNNLTRASDADWDVIGTGSAYMSIWFKSTGESGTSRLFGFANSGNTVRFGILLQADGQLNCLDDGATASVETFLTGVNDDSVWHKADFVRVSSTERYGYLDGVLKNSVTTDSGSISDSGNLPLGIGIDPSGSGFSAAASTLALARLSATAPTAAQVRQMYDAEKPMFVASAECLLQSSSTDAVLDVDVDPLTGKVLVTQTDAITIFDGLAVDSKPTVNSGNSEKGKLWGDLRAEQNSANAYVTAPAVDQRQVNEMVRGLASDLPKGSDPNRGIAKAAISFKGDGTEIYSSFNVKSLTDVGTGNWIITWGQPFAKDEEYYVTRSVVDNTQVMSLLFAGASNQDRTKQTILNYTGADSGGSLSLADCEMIMVTAFGTLENEQL